MARSMITATAISLCLLFPLTAQGSVSPFDPASKAWISDRFVLSGDLGNTGYLPYSLGKTGTGGSQQPPLPNPQLQFFKEVTSLPGSDLISHTFSGIPHSAAEYFLVTGTETRRRVGQEAITAAGLYLFSTSTGDLVHSLVLDTFDTVSDRMQYNQESNTVFTLFGGRNLIGFSLTSLTVTINVTLAGLEAGVVDKYDPFFFSPEYDRLTIGAWGSSLLLTFNVTTGDRLSTINICSGFKTHSGFPISRDCALWVVNCPLKLSAGSSGGNLTVIDVTATDFRKQVLTSYTDSFLSRESTSYRFALVDSQVFTFANPMGDGRVGTYRFFPASGNHPSVVRPVSGSGTGIPLGQSTYLEGSISTNGTHYWLPVNKGISIVPLSPSSTMNTTMLELYHASSGPVGYNSALTFSDFVISPLATEVNFGIGVWSRETGKLQHRVMKVFEDFAKDYRLNYFPSLLVRGRSVFLYFNGMDLHKHSFKLALFQF